MTDRGQGRLPGELDRRAARLHPRQQGQGSSRMPASARRRTSAACSYAGTGHQDDLGALQGHRAGDDRPARRPGGHDVRPDHQHHRPDPKRQGQGLRRDHQGAAVPRCPTCRRWTSRPEGLRGAAWHGLYAPKGTPRRWSTSSSRRCSGAQGPQGDGALRRPRQRARVPGAGHAGCPGAALQAEIEKWSRLSRRRVYTPTDHEQEASHGCYPVAGPISCLFR